MNIYAPTSIDLSRLPPPSAVVVPSHEQLLDAALARFKIEHDAQRAIDPTLPEYSAEMLASDPVVIALRTWTFLRVMDYGRVNDAFRGLLAPLANGDNLDQIAATRNLARLIVGPATTDTPAVMEGDDALLRRYLLSFDRPSAGSPAGILYEAWTAWPSMGDARVNGYGVHGRRGDRDLVIIGPGGRLATPSAKAQVRAAVTAPHVTPEAYGLTVIDAVPVEYDVRAVIEVPPGPDANLITAEALARLRTVANERMQIGAEIPAGLLAGACYGRSIIKVRDLAPVTIAPDPYAVPVLRNLDIVAEVRS